MKGKHMRLRNAVKIALPLLLAAALFAAENSAKSATVKGYVLDSACAFTKGLKKPVSGECAVACAKAGSPLVILSSAGTIYWITRGDPAFAHATAQKLDRPSLSCRPPAQFTGPSLTQPPPAVKTTNYFRMRANRSP